MKHKNLVWSFPLFAPSHWNKKKIAILLLSTIIFSMLIYAKNSFTTYAASLGSVVINEVAWAGSADSGTDEWIELYNTTNQDIDLSNWYIQKDASSTKYKILNGNIPAHGYFLIEDHESAVLTVVADSIINVSLSNTGNSLELFDNNNQIMDTVNSSMGAWPGGNAASKATMERLDPVTSGDIASNWGTSTGSGDQASGNSNIIGTPKKANVASAQVPGQNAIIDITLDSINPQIGGTLTATIKAQNVTNLFAYGFDLSYDPALLHFNSAAEQNFLNSNNTVQTSFQAGLENNTDGKILVAGARTNGIKTGVDGTGNLLEITFDVIGANPNPNTLHFDQNSFLANPNGDITTQFTDPTFTIQANVQVSAVTNLQIIEGPQRYSLSLSWDASPNATSYQISRQDAHGQWKLLQEIQGINFIDENNVTNGGFIIPQHIYNYQIIAVNGNNTSAPTQGSQKDTRGLKGDNNRSDRVDGRDLEQLARHFGEIDTDATFNKLVDTTYDGSINGSDLIDLGANFALTYS